MLLLPAARASVCRQPPRDQLPRVVATRLRGAARVGHGALCCLGICLHILEQVIDVGVGENCLHATDKNETTRALRCEKV